MTSLSPNRGHDPRTGQGSGFDLLLPKGWGMPFWLSLVFNGARCGGLKELENVSFESRSLLFPNSYPDTISGVKFELENENEKIDKYNRIPPAKRVNFNKMDIPSPFRCPWENLVAEFVSSETSEKANEEKCNETATARIESGNAEKEIEELKNVKFFVLRSAKVLRQLQMFCHPQSLTKLMKSKTGELNVESIINRGLLRALVAVKVDMLHRGCPGDFSVICIPEQTDIDSLERDKNYGGPLEPPCQDPVLVERSKLKKEMKEKGSNMTVKVDRTLKVLNQREGVRVRSGSRKVIGYLSSGGYALGSGHSAGLGFIAAVGLKQLSQRPIMKDKGAIVLVRSTTSLQYRFANLSVVV